jgi:predicted RNA-binding Zn ribbon-like protein
MASSTSRRPFDFTGNHPVIDFTNTVNGRPVFTRDDFGEADDVFEWAAQAGLLTEGASVKTSVDLSEFEAVIALRENLYRVFGAIAAGDPPPQSAVALLARRTGQAVRSARWERSGSRFVPRWSAGSLESICDQLADEALTLLRSPSVARVGACAGCGWLFLDTSRAHARRWCSMNVCGVRDKMRRYHQRLAHPTSVT